MWLALTVALQFPIEFSYTVLKPRSEHMGGVRVKREKEKRAPKRFSPVSVFSRIFSAVRRRQYLKAIVVG